MGYVPPPLNVHNLPNFGLQYVGDEPPLLLFGYERYRRDLYGPRPTDWLPVLSGAFLIALIALVVAVTALVVESVG